MYSITHSKALLRLFVFLNAFFFVGSSFAKNPDLHTKPNEIQIVEDLNQNWIVFDKYYNEYVPYLNTNHTDYHSFSQLLSFENRQNLQLSIFSSKKGYLFLDNVYFLELSASQWENIHVNTLQKRYPHQKQLLITLYFPEKDLGSTEIYLSNLANNKAKLITKKIDTKAKTEVLSNKIFKTYYKDIMVLCIVLLLILFLFLRQNQSMITDKYLNFNDLFVTSRRIENYVINKPFEFGNLYFLTILCGTTSLLLLEINKNYIEFLPVYFNLKDNYSILNHLQLFAILTIIGFLGYLFKYLLITLISGLYRLNKIENIHYFKVIQYNAIILVFLAVLFGILSHYWVYQFTTFKIAIQIIFVLFFVIRLFLIYSNIINLGKVKILHLFSYLCIVELAPILFGIQFIL